MSVDMDANCYKNYSRIIGSHEKFAQSLFNDVIMYGKPEKMHRKSQTEVSHSSMYTEHRRGVHFNAMQMGLAIPIVSVGKSGDFSIFLRFQNGALQMENDGKTRCTVTAMSVPPLAAKKSKDTWYFTITPEPVPHRKDEVLLKYSSAWLTSKVCYQQSRTTLSCVNEGRVVT